MSKFARDSFLMVFSITATLSILAATLIVCEMNACFAPKQDNTEDLIKD